jgi:hypothetical protein
MTDANLDGGSLWLEPVTGESTQVVYEIMTKAQLYVVAPLIAPSVSAASEIDTPWPGTHVATDAAALFALLRN